ncbi:S8 family serine peptidase [Streptomyces sannanensis]
MALALATGGSTPALAAATTADHGTAKSAEKHWITLITGDRVAVGDGGRVEVRRGKGREGIPVRVRKADGHTLVVPLDAQRLLDTGRLDRRLFDITELGKAEYRTRDHAALRLIVGYKGAAPAARDQVRDAGGTQVGRTFRQMNAEAVSTPEQDAAKVWEALTVEQHNGPAQRTTAPGIDKVWLDGIRRASLDKSVAQIGAPKAWAAGFDGKGVKIAVLDTGVDQTHPDLAGQQLAEKNFSAASDTKDRFGHGTHVASIAVGTGAKSGGKYKGVAPGARILDGKVLDDQGFGDDSNVLAGMEWAAAQGADVVNLSLGGPDAPETDPLEQAVDRLSAEKGILFVIAAGNEGPDAGTVGSPGSADAALTIGAVDDSNALAPFSSRGPRAAGGAVKPDVTAPGVDITAASAPGSLIAREVGERPAGYVTISGTSMATPHAAGAAALLKQQHPDWKGDRLKSVLAASTTPGGYSAFNQGTGRIDVPRAMKQSVIAEPVSVGFDRQQWPHTDDRPTTKKVTYRNLGTAPVTLDLSVSGAFGPDGKPAPAGFFTVGTPKVTVPAGGTADAELTADTRLGGSVDGNYSATLVAVGGGQTVRTTAAVEREIEAYNLTVKHLGRDGRPTRLYESMLQGLSGLGQGSTYSGHDDSGTYTIRVPRGGYVLEAAVLADERDVTKGLDYITQPELAVTKDTTVTVDARTTKPVDITVPDSRAKSQFATISFDMSAGDYGYSSILLLDSFKGFRTAHLGPELPARGVFQQFSAGWTKGAADYHLAYGGIGSKLATGFTRHAKQSDFATLTTRLGASVKDRSGSLTVFPMVDGGTGSFTLSSGYKLPTTRTLYLNAAGVKWYKEFDQYRSTAAEPVYEAGYYSPATRYKAGKSYQQSFNIGVFGPRVGGDLGGVYRVRDTISGCVSVFADGAGHDGGSRIDTATTTLYRNGVKVGSNKDPLSCGEGFKVPSGKADYRMTATVTRSKVASVSTKVSISWTFSSKRTSAETRLPVSVVRFTPSLGIDSTAKAGATVKVPVKVEGAAAGRNLKSLTVYVSYDDGRTWKKAPVTRGSVTVVNPKAGKGISFKAKVTDRQGNTLTQSVHNAYLGK